MKTLTKEPKCPKAVIHTFDIESVNTEISGEEFYYKEAFSRNLGLLSLSEQAFLRGSKVGIPGMGGVGGLHLVNLVRLGISNFHIADFDKFEIGNINRQYGAKRTNLNRSKVFAMAREAMDINPYLNLQVFENGINSDNIDAFLEGVDVVVDSLDFFEMKIRRMLFNKAKEKKIYVITAGPMGYSTAMLVFAPDTMSFDKYFNIHDSMSEKDMVLQFGIGLSPRLTHLRYLDMSRFSVDARKGPSLGLSCHLSTAAAATEVIRILLQPNKVKSAPHYFQYDLWLKKFITGYMPLGNRNPIQKLKVAVYKIKIKQMAKLTVEKNTQINSNTLSINKPVACVQNDFEINKIDKAYSSEPWWYDLRGFLILTFSYRSTLLAQVRLFSKNMGDKHLEAAIGTGTLLDLILKWRRWRKMKPSQIFGFDYADRMLVGARKRFQNEKSVELLRADISRLPYSSESFDTANIANAIHCLPAIEAGMKELHRVLKPNGTLAGNVLLYPHAQSIWDQISNRINSWGMKKGILHRPYQVAEVKEIISNAGFKLIFEKISGNCFEFTARKVLL
ncbi:MAG: ThiF family adenylyltransferase [Bacteroidetes bacterium]|nr:ThiF family adenylyltransferase [Bacteroidota bacterium]